MIGKLVDIDKKIYKKDRLETVFKGRVKILDKVMTNMAEYTKVGVINNAPMDVYVGELDPDIDSDCPVILFKPTDITKIY